MWTFLGILCLLQACPMHAEMTINIEDAEPLNWDPEYISDMEMRVNEALDDINTMTMNFTIIKELPEDCVTCFTVLGFSAGDYTMDTGIDACEDTVEVFQDTMIVGPLLECMGISADQYPPPPGSYGKSNWTPDTEQMPDSFPSGKYCAKVDTFTGESKLLELLVYFQVL